MKLSSYIAKRYFFSKRSSNAVNIITGISVGGILVGTAALIVVLSAFNGLEQLVRSFYSDFDPDLKITPHSGKFFDPGSSIHYLDSMPEVAGYSLVLEEKALLSFREREYIATLKGVDSSFRRLSGVSEHLRYGQYIISNELPFVPAVMGAGVAYFLGFTSNDLEEPIQIFVPRAQSSALNPGERFRQESVYPLGVFSIQPEFDEKYVLLPLGWTQKLLQRGGQVSALEVALHHESELEAVQLALRQKLDPSLSLANRDEQQAAFFKVMKTEGLFTFLIFALILAIATFTISGSLTMLMFEKRQNLHSLWAMGVNLPQLRRIFLKLGFIIAGVGAVGGLSLGLLLIFAQQRFGLISVGEGYLIDAYPVELHGSDIFLVLITVFALSSLASWLSAQRLHLKLLKTR